MAWLTWMNSGFEWILQTSWQASVLAVLILLAQLLLRKQLSPGWRYGLWLLLVARLMMPMTPPSPLSLFNLAKSSRGVWRKRLLLPHGLRQQLTKEELVACCCTNWHI